MGRRLALAAASGALLCLTHGFAPLLGPVAPVPLLVALRSASPRQALYAGLVAGAANSVIVAGFSHAGPLVYLAVLLSYAAFMALFAVPLAALAPRLESPLWCAAAASLWVLAEWLHAAVPYAAPNIFGDTQHAGPLLPLARVGGTYVISFVLVAAAAGLGELWLSRSGGPSARRQALSSCAAVLAIFGLLATWARLAEPEPRGSLSVVAVQGGLPTWLYRRSEHESAFRGVPTEIYAALTRRAGPADLTVWPETAVWRYWGEDRDYEALLQRLRAEQGGALLAGVPRRDAASSLANAAVLLSPDRAPTFADKQRLALLAESAFSPAAGPEILEVASGKVGVVFCLETVAPQYARAAVLAGAELLVVLAEGSRFGATPVSHLHAKRSIVRAVESGRSVVHAGQHGYTAVIAPDGTHTPPLAPYTASYVRQPVAWYDSQTPYVRFGPWIVGVSALLSTVAVIRAALVRFKRRELHRRG